MESISTALYARVIGSEGSIQSILCPKNFFPVEIPGFNSQVPTAIQEEIFRLLSRKQILQVLGEHQDCKDSKCDVFTLINQPSVVKKLRNLVIAKFSKEVSKILSRVPELSGFSGTVNCYRCFNYETFCSSVRTHLELGMRFMNWLKSQPVFAQIKDLSIGLRNFTQVDTAIGWATDVMKEHLPVSYLYLMNFNRNLLHEFWFDYDKPVLTKDPKMWKAFLNRFWVWASKREEYTPEDILFRIFYIQLRGFNYMLYYQTSKTWDDLFNAYCSQGIKEFSYSDSIQNSAQLITVAYLRIDRHSTRELIPTVCKIIGFVSEKELDFLPNRAADNVCTGMRKAMANLIKTWPTVFQFLKAVSEKVEFLRILSKSNWVFDDLTVIDQYVRHVIQEGELLKLAQALSWELDLLIVKLDEDYKKIDTAEKLFTWINKNAIDRRVNSTVVLNSSSSETSDSRSSEASDSTLYDRTDSSSGEYSD